MLDGDFLCSTIDSELNCLRYSLNVWTQLYNGNGVSQDFLSVLVLAHADYVSHTPIDTFGQFVWVDAQSSFLFVPDGLDVVEPIVFSGELCILNVGDDLNFFSAGICFHFHMFRSEFHAWRSQREAYLLVCQKWIAKHLRLWICLVEFAGFQIGKLLSEDAVDTL